MKNNLYLHIGLLLILYFPAKIQATSFSITDHQTTFDFIENVELLNLKDSNQQFTFQEVKNQNFQPYQIWKDQIATDQVYWGRFQIKNELPASTINSEWVMEFSLVWTDVDVFVEYSDGKIITSKTGFFIPLDQRTFTPVVKGNAVRLEILNEQVVTVYFRAKCERKKATPNFNIQLSSSSHYFKTLNKKKQTQGIFIGFVMMMLIYNLFLFFFNAKDVAYIHYSIYLLGIVLYTLYNTGDIADRVTPLFFPDHPKYIYFGKTVVYFVMIGYLSFIRKFLDLSQLLPKWDIIFKYFSWFTAFMFFVDIYLMLQTNFNYDIADLVTVGTSLVFLVTTFIFCIWLYRTHDKKGYFIILGLFMMGTGSVLTIWDRINTVDYSTFYFKLGTILELIVFSLGLVYRRKQIEQEKQSAFFELEKSKILQEQERKEATRLKELDNLKTQLYTNITHEFRTPLTVIMGVSDNIAGHQNEKKIIHRNSSQLLRLINQMLDLSKIESNLMQINWVHSNIVSYLQYITESFHSMARSKNVRLAFYSEEESIMMDFDKTKMEHLAYNLISNAIKFTPSGGKIIFHVKKIEQDAKPLLQIKIKDTGVGIAKEDLPNIFNRFYQKSDNNATMGTGIGLAFVKELVELFEGTIVVKSEVNLGSEFIITLPITDKAKQITTIAHDIKYENGQALDVIPLTKTNDESDQPLLLLIEDNLDVANYIQTFLSKTYNIHLAFDGKKGIEDAFNIIPDIIISDVMMPKKNGYEVTQTLKNDERTCHIPIILLTAKATQNDKIEGLESGADAFLMKPFHKKELLIRLENLHQQRQVLVNKYKSNSQEQSSEEESTTEPSLDDLFLQKIQSFIEENLNDPELGVMDLCQEVNLSKNQLYRKIKALTDQPPTLFIRSVRLNKAIQLLKTTELNVSEVAYEVGFNDPNYFSRVFNREFGEPPSAISK